MKDLTVGLRNLGFRVDQVRRAVEHCMTIPNATLEQHVRAALKMLCSNGSTPAVVAGARSEATVLRGAGAARSASATTAAQSVGRVPMSPPSSPPS